MCKIVEYWCAYRQTYAEGTFFDGTVNKAYFGIEASAGHRLVIIHVVCSNAVCAVSRKIFIILQMAVHVDIVHTKGGTHVKLVADVEREVEVVLLYASPLGTIIVVSHRIARRVDAVAVGIASLNYHLCIVTCNSQRRGVVAVVVVAEVQGPAIVIGKFLHLPRLRSAIRRGNVVEANKVFKIAPLLVVEGKVGKIHALAFTIACFEGIYKTGLVERAACLVYFVKRLTVGLYGGTTRKCHIAATVHAYGGRIGANGRQVGSQCAHGTTHAHIACCTIKVAAAEGFYFIYVLRTHAAAQCKGRERYGIFEFHNLLVYGYLCNSPILVS